MGIFDFAKDKVNIYYVPVLDIPDVDVDPCQSDLQVPP